MTLAGPFRNGQFSGSSHASFDRHYDAVTLGSVATTTQGYTVRGGDTLAGIAQVVWGDANLWYLVAAANGLSADETLAEGRVLTIAHVLAYAPNDFPFGDFPPSDKQMDLESAFEQLREGLYIVYPEDEHKSKRDILNVILDQSYFAY